MSYINRADVTVYVERCLPNENLEDFDLEAIADGLITDYPEVIGEHNLIDDYPDAVDRTNAYLDETFDAEHFWIIVQRFDRIAKEV